MMITQKRSENLIYILLWLLIFSLPVFTLKGGDEFNQNRVFFEWIRTFPFLIIFIINNSLLVPKLLFRKKTLIYTVSVTAIILAFSIFNDLPRLLHEFLFQEPSLGPRPGPHGNPMRPGGPMMQGDPFGGFHEPLNNRPPVPAGNKSFSFLVFENIIISFLGVGFNNAIKLGVRRQKEVQQLEEKEKIHLETELSFLRQQISPHFFMNTLNNIHALIEMDQIQAQKSVIELSKLMRYLLNESQEGIATIKSEFEFLNSYIDLMRIRYSDKVKIDIHYDVKEDFRKIPSLLYISLVENAFKYGVSYSQDSYIHINVKQDKNELKFEIKNSVSSQSKAKKGTGVGLVNLKKQLNILFKEKHTFEIIESEKEYQTNLIIPIQDD